MLTQVRRGVADVATSRKRVELQMNQLQQQQDKLDRQARQALGGGREDLAREALTRKAGLQSQLSDLQTQYQRCRRDEEKLTAASQRLQAKVEAFRTQKETIKATYTAAEAQTRIGEAVSGISEEMGDVGMAVQRAQDKTAQMQARAGAIDELMASGALDDVTAQPNDDIQRELDQMGGGHDVDRELAADEGRARPGRGAAGDRGLPHRRARAGSQRRQRPGRPRRRRSRRPVTGHDRPDPRRGPAARGRLACRRAERAGRQAGGGGERR